MSIRFEEGTLRISEKALEEISKKKGFDLKIKIEKEGIKINTEKNFFGFDLPINIFISEIKIEGEILKLKNFKINLSIMPVPLISILPFLKKYPYLALDIEKGILNVNLKEIIPKNFEIKLEKIKLKEGEIEVNIKNLTILL